MPYPVFKTIVILFLVLITFNLFRALYYLVTGKGNGKSTVHYLSWRIGLSVALFLILVILKATGLVEPHDLNDLSHLQEQQASEQADEESKGKTLDEIQSEENCDGRVRLIPPEQRP